MLRMMVLGLHDGGGLHDGVGASWVWGFMKQVSRVVCRILADVIYNSIHLGCLRSHRECCTFFHYTAGNGRWVRSTSH
jgi:hypothetical protein